MAERRLRLLDDPVQILSAVTRGRIVAADGRRLATRDEGAWIQDLQTALATEGGQGALQRTGGDVEAPDAVRRLCDHRRSDCQHQRGERG